MQAYRVNFRSGGFWSNRKQRSIVVFGEEALEKCLARKSPTAIWFAGALEHTCQVCGTSGHWTDQWIAWGRYHARHAARGDGDDVYCSQACFWAENPGAAPPSWMNLNEEPLPQGARRALWQAQRLDSDAVAAARRAVRGVPMPEWPGDGHCKWCTKSVERPRRSWHADCYKTYLWHTDPNCQAVHLRKRDGPLCQWAGCEHRGVEVDHRVPLWSVAHLPDDDRRRFFGPDNLWLLCQTHHAAKTKAEAGLRAKVRAGASALHLFPTPPQKGLAIRS